MSLTTEDYRFMANVINAKGSLIIQNTRGLSRVGYRMKSRDEALVRKFHALAGGKVLVEGDGLRITLYGQEFIDLFLQLASRLKESRRAQLQAAIAWWEQRPQAIPTRSTSAPVCPTVEAKVAKRSFWSRLFGN